MGVPMLIEQQTRIYKVGEGVASGLQPDGFWPVRRDHGLGDLLSNRSLIYISRDYYCFIFDSDMVKMTIIVS